MFSISESARRRFLLFQGAFKQVIEARSGGLARTVTGECFRDLVQNIMQVTPPGLPKSHLA